MVTATPGAPAAPQDSAAYGALFARYLEAGLQRSLAQVAEDPHKVADAVRSQAWHLLSFALRSPAAWPLAADLLLALSPKMVQAGYREQWLAYLEQGLACSREAGDTQTAAALQLEIGEVLRHLGRLAPAEACFQDALATFTAAGDTVQAAAAQVCLANLLVRQEKWTQALALCEQTLAAVPEVHPVRARALFVAADAHVARQEDNKASELYRVSMTQWETLGELRWQALCVQNLAWLAAKGGELDAARGYYGTALQHFTALNALHSQAIVNLDWGIIEYLQRNYSEALKRYQLAETVFQQLGDVRCLAMVCNNIGLLHLNLGNWHDGERYYAASIALWHKLGVILSRISVEIDLAQLWFKRGDIQQALDYFDTLKTELAKTDRSVEHQRLYAELCEYHSQALAALREQQSVAAMAA
jgi:tetratricopeptide (TPR) repeat protein